MTSIAKTAALTAATLLLIALPARAAVFADPPLDPASPIAGQAVIARIFPASCTGVVPFEVVRNGSLIEIRGDDQGCPIATPPPPTLVSLDLGGLPAGTYDLRIVDTNPQPTIDDETVFTVQAADCPADTLCLQAGRLEVTAQWRTRDGATGKAHPVPQSDETGSFWFFTPTNYELMVKALDGCRINGNHWFYAGGLTDVNVVVTVVDLENLVCTGPICSPETVVYENPQGQPFEPVGDVHHFGCVCITSPCPP